MINSSSSAGVPALATVEQLASSARARRRVASTNLLMLGAGILAVGLGWTLLDAGGTEDGLLALVVPSTFCTLWAVTSIRAHRLGVRSYRVGYAAVAVVSVLSILCGLLPFSATVGTVTLLGAGFLILGWRERSQPVWITAVVGIVVGSVTSGQPVRQILGIPENPVSSLISVLLTAAFAVIVLAVGTWMFLAESREMTNRDR